MGKIGIFYGSTEGNTEDVVEKVKKALGNAAVIRQDHPLGDSLEQLRCDHDRGAASEG